MKSQRLFWDNLLHIEKLVESLLAGNISIGTSDTVAGFMAVPSQETFDQISATKGREGKPYLVLAHSVDEVARFAQIPETLRLSLKKVWPGPVTIIFSVRENVPSFMKSAQNTIAFRVPNHKGLQSVLEKTGALFSTSANKAGFPSPVSVNDVEADLLKSIPFVVSDRNVGNGSVLPSTILDCSGSEVKLIREGAYPIDQLEKQLGRKIGSITT